MWSLGLVAVELATGLPLYPGNEDYDVLKFIIETQGQPPDHVLDSGVYTEDYFIEDKDKQQRWTFKTDQQFQYETGYESLETRCIKLTRLDDLEQIIMFRRGPEAGQRLFVSLIKQMLALDAHQRITPSEVLRHPFFSPKSSLCIDMSAEISQNPVVFHSVGIVHADLKPGNIMVVNRHESPIKVKLIDFGLACPASAVIPGDFVGTVGYCAPEVMLGLPYNEASDMWSLGLVAVELATGLPLYPSENDYDYLKFIIETQGQPPDHVLDSDKYNLIKQMLALDAHQRITPSQVLRHPFFSPGLSKRFPCINIERPY
uniref:Protein kinase domain-containing protein n=1 Tax=Maylandia zebra TaxID=106582 RepID=A0A3P9D8Y5_9CICH